MSLFLACLLAMSRVYVMFLLCLVRYRTHVKELGHKLLEELADAIHKTRVEFNRLPGIKPVFRLHPPSKGSRAR